MTDDKRQKYQTKVFGFITISPTSNQHSSLTYKINNLVSVANNALVLFFILIFFFKYWNIEILIAKMKSTTCLFVCFLYFETELNVKNVIFWSIGDCSVGV